MGSLENRKARTNQCRIHRIAKPGPVFVPIAFYNGDGFTQSPADPGKPRGMNVCQMMDDLSRSPPTCRQRCRPIGSILDSILQSGRKRLQPSNKAISKRLALSVRGRGQDLLGTLPRRLCTLGNILRKSDLAMQYAPRLSRNTLRITCPATVLELAILPRAIEAHAPILLPSAQLRPTEPPC